MTISIVTICLNDIQGLIKTRESVVAQISHNYEHIIIDGGSDDGTIDYLTRVTDDAVHWISEPDRGISDAFNKGINTASGDIILCLNAGDELYDEHVIENVIKDWNEDPVDVLSYRVERSDGRIMWCKNEDDWSNGLHGHQGVLVTKEAYGILGGYNVCLKSRMDYDLFLRMAKLNLSHRMINRVIARFDTNGISQYDKNLAFSEGAGIRLSYNNKLTEDDIKMLKEFNCIDDSSSNKTAADDKEKKYTLIYNWLGKIIEGKSINDYLENNQYQRISIYGAGQLGALLIKELNHSSVSIVDLLDLVEEKYIGDYSSIKIEAMNTQVDAVIVTVIDGFDEIRERIKQINDVKVISLKEIVASI